MINNRILYKQQVTMDIKHMLYRRFLKCVQVNFFNNAGHGM